MKGSNICSPSEGRAILSRNVIVKENSMVDPTAKSIVGPNIFSVEVQVEHYVTHDDSDETHEDNQHINYEAPQPSTPSEEAPSLARERPTRMNIGKSPNRYRFEDMMAYAVQVDKDVDVYEPSTHRGAVTCT